MSPFTFLEILATISGILCVYLQTKEKILAWPFGILSVTISAYIFFHSKLYSDLGLHVIYIFLNIYGWYNWSRKEADLLPPPILSMGKRAFLFVGLIIIAMSSVLGFTMGSLTDADLYYYDAFTTSGSLVAQFLLAKKYIQNWIVWIIVDIVAIPLYIYKGLYFFAFLFFVYLVICTYGYFSWRRSMDN